jgi:hypothetical protein
LRCFALQGLPAAPVSPNRFGSEVILSWSWLLFEVYPAFNRPVCSPSIRPLRAGGRDSCTSVLVTRTGSPEISSPFSVTRPGRPDWLWGYLPHLDPSSGFLDLLTVYAARTLAALFHAAYAPGIRPSEHSPSRKPCFSRSRCSPAVGHLRELYALDCRRAIPRVPSRPVASGCVTGRVPLERASSFIDSPTRFFRW